MKRSILFLSFVCGLAFAGNQQYLVKLKAAPEEFVADHGGTIELVSEAGHLYLWKTDSRADVLDMRDSNVEFIEKNHVISIFKNPSIEANRAAILKALANSPEQARGPAFPDNPDIKDPASETSGTDPMLKNSWGIDLIGANKAWTINKGKEIIVAVTDTGVDYNHPDLLSNMWHNSKEVANDKIDNDNNGYVDDIVGWDFVSDDNKPYDLSLSLIDIMFSGGNPGHGTHVAGVVGARLNNSLGTVGVAPEVKIMALRFIGEKGQGDSAGAIKAIDYAVANGARVINASWGSEGEEEGDDALREAIQRAEAKGVVFVAAAGNGRVNQTTMQGEGFNNDTDSKPMYPCSYPYENIISVAAFDSSLAIAKFSNFGKKSVDIGAPGVKILSTVPGGKYQDTIIDLGSMKVTWDGTSMASPFVAGSVAVLMSRYPALSGKEIKDKLLSSTVALSSLSGKVFTDGRVDLSGLSR